MGVKLNKKQKFGIFMAALSAVAASVGMIIAALTGNNKAIKKALDQVEESKKNDQNRTNVVNAGEEQKKENTAIAKETSSTVADVVKAGENQIKTNEEIIKENEALLGGK